MKIYLSGPMTGIENNNFETFAAAAKDLREEGHEVINPAEQINKSSWTEYMRHDIAELVKCDAVAVLLGWNKSKGAKIEVYIAEALGIPVSEWPSNCKVKLDDSQSVLMEAQNLVHGDRHKQYGHPIDDFGRTAKMWNALWPHWKTTPEQVGLAMVCVKLSREINNPKRDNRVDGPGYFEAVDMIHRRKEWEAKRGV